MSEIKSNYGMFIMNYVPSSDLWDMETSTSKRPFVSGLDYLVCLTCGCKLPQDKGCMDIHEAFHKGADIHDLVKELRIARGEKISVK